MSQGIGKYRFGFGLMTAICGIINIVMTGFLIYLFTVYPSGIDVTAHIEGLLMYVLIFQAAISLVTIASVWYNYIVLYKLGAMHKQLSDVQEVILYMVTPKKEKE